MRKEISITKTCQLEIETEPEATFLGWKYAIGDGGSGGASTFATLDTDAEFNALASHSPLFKRMAEFLKSDDHFTASAEGRLCCLSWTDTCDSDCPRQKILAEIARLEKA